ncbi:MAG: copper resistance D family protein [Dermatophilaceae bacterium]
MALLPVDRLTRPKQDSPAPHRPDSSRPGRPKKTATTVLVLVGLVLVLVVSLWAGGARPSQDASVLPDPGAVTRWGLPSAELAARLLAVLTIGRLVLAALLVPARTVREPELAGGAVRAAAGSAAAWLLAEAAVLVLTASNLYAVPVTDLSVQGLLGLRTLPVGRSAAVVSVLLLALVAGCAIAARRRHACVLLMLALLSVIVPVVAAGHSASASNHLAAVATLTVHVVAASLWVGGLAALLLHGRSQPWTVPSLRRFSALALACVIALALTGSLAAVLVTDPWRVLLGSGYGSLLLTKTGLLVLLAAMGWWHRKATLPALTLGRPRTFLRLAAVEVVLMGAVLAVSMGLSASPPPSAELPVAAVAATADPAPAASEATPDTDPRPDDVSPPEDMSAHDHGELSVGVLVDAERFHVSTPVRPSQPVTVYNSSNLDATLTARDGSFNVNVPARTFITFQAPTLPGTYEFENQHDSAFLDLLHVRQD